MGFLRKFDLTPLNTDSCVLVRSKKDDILIIAIYVDDGLACSNNVRLLDDIVKFLQQQFEITLMEATCFVGLEIQRDRMEKKFSVNQANYIKRVVKRFELENALICRVPVSPC